MQDRTSRGSSRPHALKLVASRQTAKVPSSRFSRVSVSSPPTSAPTRFAGMRILRIRPSLMCRPGSRQKRQSDLPHRPTP
jgi:hypothetical protein